MNFFIQFFCKNRKNSIFREKFFGAENYRSKIDGPIDEHSLFLKYLENREIFDFFHFFYEVRRSSTFQPTCR